MAVLLVAFAAILRAMFFGDLGRTTPYLTFYPAVMAAAFYGGLSGGMVATGLSAPVCVYWIQGGFMSHIEWHALAVFIMACAMVSWVSEAMLRAQTRAKRAEEMLRDSNRTLEDRILERTNELSTANESLRHEIGRRKRVEDELHLRDAELTEAQRIAGLGSWLLDPDTGEVRWSEHLFRIFGRDPGLPVLNFKDHAEILTPEGVEVATAAVEKALRDGKPYELELEFYRPDGTRGWIASRGEAKRDENGRIVGLRGTVLDITERKEAESRIQNGLKLETALRKIDEKILMGANFREALDIACDAIVDLGYRMCWVGLAEPDFSVRPVMSRGFDEGYLDRMKFRWDESPEGMGPTGIAIRTGRPYVCRDILASRIYAPWHGEAAQRGYRASASIPLRSGEGGTIGVLHVYSRTTESFIPEEINVLEMFAQQCAIALVSAVRIEELKTVSRRLSLHVQRMPLAYIVWDKDLRAVEWNPMAERIFGWSAAEASGKHPYELIVPLETQLQVDEVFAKLAGGGESSSVLKNIRKDGRKITCEWFNTSLKDGSGEYTGILSMVHDISEKIRLERQLQTAQRMESVGTLAGGIAHDFNNALTGILGFGDLLRGRLAGDEQGLHDLEEILHCAERASTLTRQLLAYARRQVIEPLNMSLNALVTDLMRLIKKVVGEHIDVTVLPAAGLPAIHADRGQIEQVLMNLCLNARDAMPEGGRLLVETEEVYLDEEYIRHNAYMRKGRYALLKVSDNGIGMDEKTRERVFEPFFTTKGSEKGTGLGMAMVYGIVKQHDGFLHLYSEPGKGTTFKVYFPATDAPPDAVPETLPGRAVRGGSETILLAEDDEVIRLLAERTLKELGYCVHVARNGEEAIDISRRNGEIVLAVLDVVMPVMGGKEAFEVMHGENPRLKVIFMSGYSPNAIHDTSVLIAGVPFLQKPFGPTKLARRIREVLDTAR